jgi:hypothetical protein
MLSTLSDAAKNNLLNFIKMATEESNDFFQQWLGSGAMVRKEKSSSTDL